MKPIIFDSSDGQELRINMISSWLKKHYKDLGLEQPSKIVKLSIDGGFTCPNRDGRKGSGGCLFCSESGSGDMASTVASEQYESSDWTHLVKQALESQMKLLEDKWPKEKYKLKYIAYFQSHTNTYAPVSKLRELFEAALEHPDVIGLAIATRSDCISEEALELLHELSEKTFMWVELGLQTIHDKTAKAMNLCHTVGDYAGALMRLQSKGIRVVTHLILGLPGESRAEMIESLRYVCQNKDVFGIKLHMLNVVRGSGLEVKYPDYNPFDTMDEYIDLLIEALEIIPPEITLHRISGDAPRNSLIAPEWSYKKRTILNKIHKSMKERNTWQGKSLSV